MRDFTILFFFVTQLLGWCSIALGLLAKEASCYDNDSGWKVPLSIGFFLVGIGLITMVNFK